MGVVARRGGRRSWFGRSVGSHAVVSETGCHLLYRISRRSVLAAAVVAVGCMVTACSSGSNARSGAKREDPLAGMPKSSVGHVNGIELSLVLLETGQIAHLAANATVPLEGENRFTFLMGLAFRERYSLEILKAYLTHAALQLANEGQETEGISFAIQDDLEGVGKWWIADMEDCEFGTTSGSVRRGEKVIVDLSKGMGLDDVWEPFGPDTYDQWWRLVDEKHHISELLALKS